MNNVNHILRYVSMSIVTVSLALQKKNLVS